LLLPNKGNLERGIFHGTHYTEHNKTTTPPAYGCYPTWKIVRVDVSESPN